MDEISSTRPESSTTFQVFSSTASSLHLKWHVTLDIAPFIQAFRIHYQKMESTYIQYSSMLSATTTEYWIKSLVADTYYNVCLVQYRNDTKPIRECIDASTTKWHIPVSIGSSIGAVLALSMIVLIVLLSRCSAVVKLRRKASKGQKKYNSMSQHYHTDEHYDFSDTVTNGHEDDIISDQDVSYVFEIPNSRLESRHGSITTDKVLLADGRDSQVFSQYHNPHIKYIGGKHSMDSHLMMNQVALTHRQSIPKQCSSPHHHPNEFQEAYLIPSDAYIIRDNQIIILPVDETGKHRHSSLPARLYDFQESDETEVQGAEGGIDPTEEDHFISRGKYDFKETQRQLETIPCFPEEDESFSFEQHEYNELGFQGSLHPIRESPLTDFCPPQIGAYELKDIQKRTNNGEDSPLILTGAAHDEHTV